MAQDKWQEFQTSDKWSEFEDKSVQIPPVKKEEPKKRDVLSEYATKAWDVANKPLIEAPARAGMVAAEYVDPRNLNGPQPESSFDRGFFRPFFAGALEGAGNVLAGLSSPLNLAMTAMGGGALATTGRTASALRTGTRIASAPVIGHGAQSTYEGIKENNSDSPLKIGMGIAEMAGGAAGMHFPKPRGGQARNIPIEQKALPPGKHFVDPEGTHVGGVVNPEPPISMRDKLKLADELREKKYKTFEVTDEGVTKVPSQPKTAQDYIDAVKAGKISSKEVSFDEFRNLDSMKDFEEPSFARVEGGKVKIGADIESLGKVLGSSLYKGDIGKIVTKELLQNSFDATRNLDSAADIKVTLGNLDDKSGGRARGYIQIKDNGKGMSREELETVFTDLGSSGKRNDETAAGGFGLAKAAPLLGGDKVEVISIVDVLENGEPQRIRYSFEGTPDDLLKKGVDIKEEYVDFDTPTGTDVKTYISNEGDYLSHYDNARFVEQLAQNSPGFKGKITVLRESESKTLGQKLRRSSYEDQVYEGLGNEEFDIIPLESDYATTEIMIPKNAKYGENIVKYGMLNHGLYQGTKIHSGDKIPGTPEKFLVNIKAKVPEGDPNYPYTANRESLRGFVETQVNKYIDENIVNPGLGRRRDELTRAYNEMPQIDVGRRLGNLPFYFYDVGKRFTNTELTAMTHNENFKQLGRVIGDVIEGALATSRKSTEWAEKLERVGFIFDPDVKGIYVPNPGAGKAAILINPFALIEHHSPDGASAGIVHTVLHELAHISQGHHDESFAVVLSQVTDDFGAISSIDAMNQIHTALTGRTLNDRIPFGDSNRGYTSDISSILQYYTESRGREATYNDPLYGTGTKSRTAGKGQDGDDRNTKQGAERTSAAVGKLKQALAAAIPLRQEQQDIYHVERGKRFGAFEGVTKKGFAGFKERMSKLKGEFEKVETSPLELNGKETDTLFNAIMFSKKLTPGEKARGGTALAKLINGEAVPQKGELAILDHVFGSGFAQEIIQLHGGIGAVGVRLGKVGNTMKSLMASVDLSAPFRQGIGLVHRGEFWGAFRDMFSYATSHNAFENLNKWIEDRPSYIIGRKAGLFLADTALGAREEAFLSSYLHDLAEMGPVGKAVTTPFRASERAYVGFLNKLRADTFDNLLKEAIKAGHNPEKIAPAIAKYVNVSTGRGNLGRLGKAGEELNMLFFSPRLMSSRLTVLNPKYYVDAPPFIRKEALKTLAAIGLFIGTANGIGKYAFGAEQESDPRSSDFGKMKFGNTRLDPGGGFLQYITLASRIAAQSTKSSTSDRVTPFNSGPMSPNTWSTVFGDARRQGFIETKLAPLAGLIDATLRGQDFEGKPIEMSKELMNRFTPIIIQDAVELATENPELLPLLIPTAFGMGSQTYEPRQTQRRGAFRAPSIGSMRP